MIDGLFKLKNKSEYKAALEQRKSVVEELKRLNRLVLAYEKKRGIGLYNTYTPPREDK